MALGDGHGVLRVRMWPDVPGPLLARTHLRVTRSALCCAAPAQAPAQPPRKPRRRRRSRPWWHLLGYTWATLAGPLSGALSHYLGLFLS